MNMVTIQKSKIKEEKGVVILPVGEYRKLLERAAPTYYLSGKEAEKLDKLAEEGLKEHREGKTIKAGSIKEALKKYGRGRAY
jgi:hypothetical protein